MKFKEWHQLDEARFKGFMRQFRAKHPNVPEYVLKQMYQNHLSPGMNRAIAPAMAAQNSTIDGEQPEDLPPEGSPFDPTQSTIIRPRPTPRRRRMTPPALPSPGLSPSLPSEIMNDRDLISGVKWTPKPVPVTVGPMDFTQETLDIFLRWKFGMKPNDKQVRNDTERFATQGKMAAERPEGSNEPVIMIREGGKYKLIEGFHRTMSFLLSAHDPSKGAPADQIQFLQQGGNVYDLDLSKWQQVKINAYVGERQLNAPTSYSWPRPTPNNSGDMTTSTPKLASTIDPQPSGPDSTIMWQNPSAAA